ncbi:hypothetical protein RclHR1_04490007 [Rhizophagus clarus]|uniref:Uncharacterized protein n=1 Tax=Rhizophagus clarus TaxID=94130 RepID=A0A2Z6RJ88_9GLOM|nr:hypothetical protein RclHR1_04490007 [Rhizophagus clarus]GES95366.1 hypothetical protein GLOIN_2v1799474 [Rhizophagus clarus]
MDTRHDLEMHQNNDKEDGKEEGAIVTSLPSTSLSTKSSPSTTLPSSSPPSMSATMQQSESFISDNPNASSPPKQIMDARKIWKRIEIIAKTNKKTQEIYDDFIIPYKYNPKYSSSKNRCPTGTDDNTNEKSILCDCECMGRTMRNIYNEPRDKEFKVQEVIRLRGISNWASKTDCPVDNDLGSHRNNETNDIKRVMKIDNSFFSESQSHLQLQASGISAGDRSPPFPSGSGRECTSEFNKLQVWEFLREKHLVPSSKNETRDPNQNPHDPHYKWNSNESLSKLSEIPNKLLDLRSTKYHGIHIITSEDSLKFVWYKELFKYFSERFKIISPVPLFIDDDGFVCIMEDEHGCVFMWNEMERDMQYLGPDLITGIETLLFYPDNILYDCMISDEPEFEIDEDGWGGVPTKVIDLSMGKGNKGKKKKGKNKSKRK